MIYYTAAFWAFLISLSTLSRFVSCFMILSFFARFLSNFNLFLMYLIVDILGLSMFAMVSVVFYCIDRQRRYTIIDTQVNREA